MCESTLIPSLFDHDKKLSDKFRRNGILRCRTQQSTSALAECYSPVGVTNKQSQGTKAIQGCGVTRRNERCAIHVSGEGEIQSARKHVCDESTSSLKILDDFALRAVRICPT